MTTLISDFQSIVGHKINGTAYLTAGRVRPAYGAPSVIIHEPVEKAVVDGRAIFENVNPGEAVMTVDWSDQSATLRFIVPESDEDIYLSDCITGDYFTPEEIDLLRWGIKEQISGARELIETTAAAGMTGITESIADYFSRAAETNREIVDAADRAESALETIDDKVHRTEQLEPTVNQTVEDLQAVQAVVQEETQKLLSALELLATLQGVANSALEKAGQAQTHSEGVAAEFTEAQLATLQEIETIQGNLAEASGKTQTLTESIQALSEATNTKIEDLVAALADTDLAYEEASARFTEAETQLQTLGHQYSNAVEQVSLANQELESHATQLADLANTAQAAYDALPGLRTDISTLTNQISDANGGLTDLTADLDDKISALQKVNQDQAELIAAAKQQAEKGISDAAAAKAAADNIQIGGRNLARRKDLTSGNNPAYQTLAKTDEVYDTGEAIYYGKKIASGTPPIQISGPLIMKPGETYTASIWVRGANLVSNMNANILFYGLNPSGSRASGRASGDGEDWERIVVTAHNDTNEDWDIRFYFYLNRNVGEETWYTSPQVERGNKATDWTPAPEDTEADILAAREEATTARTEAATKASEALTAANTEAVRLAAEAAAAAESSLSSYRKINDPLVSKAQGDATKGITDAAGALGKANSVDSRVTTEVSQLNSKLATAKTEATNAAAAAQVAAEKYAKEKSEADKAAAEAAAAAEALRVAKAEAAAAQAAAASDASSKAAAAEKSAKEHAEAKATAAKEAAEATAALDAKNKADKARTDAEARAKTLADAAQAAAENTALTAVGNVQIGGRNLLRGSGGEYLSTYGAGYTPTVVVEGGKRALAWTGTNNIISLGVRGGPVLQPGDWITFSFLVKASKDISIGRVYIAPGTGNTIFLSDAAVTTEWQRYTLSYQVKTSGQTHVHMYPTIKNEDGTFETFYVTDFKLEYGNKPTDWTPAPEDVNAGIATAQTQAAKGIADAKAAQDSVANIRVGGRNFVLGSGGLSPLSLRTNSITNYPSQTGVDDTGEWISGYRATSPELFALNTYVVQPWNGNIYTKELNPSIENLMQSVEVLSPEVDMVVKIGQSGTQYYIKAGVWQRISAPVARNALRPGGLYVVETAGVPSTTKLYYRKWKIEDGNVATDWTPAPEDAEAMFKEALDEAKIATAALPGINTELASLNTKAQQGIDEAKAVNDKLPAINQKISDITGTQEDLVIGLSEAATQADYNTLNTAFQAEQVKTNKLNTDFQAEQVKLNTLNTEFQKTQKNVNDNQGKWNTASENAIEALTQVADAQSEINANNTAFQDFQTDINSKRDRWESAATLSITHLTDFATRQTKWNKASNDATQALADAAKAQGDINDANAEFQELQTHINTKQKEWNLAATEATQALAEVAVEQGKVLAIQNELSAKRDKWEAGATLAIDNLTDFSVRQTKWNKASADATKALEDAAKAQVDINAVNTEFMKTQKLVNDNQKKWNEASTNATKALEDAQIEQARLNDLQTKVDAEQSKLAITTATSVAANTKAINNLEKLLLLARPEQDLLVYNVSGRATWAMGASWVISSLVPADQPAFLESPDRWTYKVQGSGVQAKTDTHRLKFTEETREYRIRGWIKTANGYYPSIRLVDAQDADLIEAWRLTSPDNRDENAKRPEDNDWVTSGSAGGYPTGLDLNTEWGYLDQVVRIKQNVGAGWLTITTADNTINSLAYISDLRISAFYPLQSNVDFGQQQAVYALEKTVEQHSDLLSQISEVSTKQGQQLEMLTELQASTSEQVMMSYTMDLGSSTAQFVDPDGYFRIYNNTGNVDIEALTTTHGNWTGKAILTYGFGTSHETGIVPFNIPEGASRRAVRTTQTRNNRRWARLDWWVYKKKQVIEPKTEAGMQYTTIGWRDRTALTFTAKDKGNHIISFSLDWRNAARGGRAYGIRIRRGSTSLRELNQTNIGPTWPWEDGRRSQSITWSGDLNVGDVITFGVRIDPPDTNPDMNITPAQREIDNIKRTVTWMTDPT